MKNKKRIKYKKAQTKVLKMELLDDDFLTPRDVLFLTLVKKLICIMR